MVDKPLPEHPYRKYEPANTCCYCGSTADLHDEHIIPFALGGKWIFPNASCAKCGKKTSAFEGVCARTMFGPMRMLYNVQTRRKRERPDKLPLRVKRATGDPWSTIDVPRAQYPFLCLLPYLDTPTVLTGEATDRDKLPVAQRFWIRGAAGPHGMPAHLETLSQQFGVAELMPTGEFDVPPFSLMLAKIAHSFVAAELGSGTFAPFLSDSIKDGDASGLSHYVGGLPKDEPLTQTLHDIGFIAHRPTPDIVFVGIRVFACLGTPTYFVAVGRRATS